MANEPNKILTWHRDFRCFCEIWKLENPLLAVCRIVSVWWINIGEIWLLNMNFLCELTILIPWLPCLFSMAKAVSSMVELVNSETSDSVNLFNFAMCAIASKCFPIELVPCCDGWSVSNGSGQSLRVRVRVQTERLSKWRSGLSINPNRQLRYDSKVNS